MVVFLDGGCPVNLGGHPIKTGSMSRVDTGAKWRPMNTKLLFLLAVFVLAVFFLVFRLARDRLGLLHRRCRVRNRFRWGRYRYGLWAWLLASAALLWRLCGRCRRYSRRRSRRLCTLLFTSPTLFCRRRELRRWNRYRCRILQRGGRLSTLWLAPSALLRGSAALLKRLHCGWRRKLWGCHRGRRSVLRRCERLSSLLLAPAALI